MPPIVRIAPSPTGPLHIGTARTALFNYLFAKKQGGKFLLRIEDTDKARSTKKFEKDILDGLKWLGLNWDGEVVYQSKRFNVFTAAAAKLVAKDQAYEKDGAMYFRIPDSVTVEFNDLIRGTIRFDRKSLEDFVILKSDGWPTYHFGVVVDDEAMRITHVIRGEDHLSNTPKHILLQKALGYTTPQYAHIPLIFNADRTKMSKRKDPVSITKDFQNEGYLPEAMINFLALLGWHPASANPPTGEAGATAGRPADEREYFSLKELIETFSLERVGKNPAIFDLKKLQDMNQRYIQQLDAKKLVEACKPLAKTWTATMESLAAMIASRGGAPTLKDLVAQAEAIASPPTLDTDLLVYKKSTKQTARQGLVAALKIVGAASSIERAQRLLEKIVRDHHLQNGDVFWSVRVALSHAEKSPGPAELLVALEPEESKKRISEAIRLLSEIQ